jgi:hypothetical protein
MVGVHLRLGGGGYDRDHRPDYADGSQMMLKKARVRLDGVQGSDAGPRLEGKW